MRKPVRWVAAAVAVAALAVFGSAEVGTATASPAATSVKYYAFDINTGGLGVTNGGSDPGFFAAPGTNSATLSQGDEMIVNDQLTISHRVSGGYPIVGYDSGVCTLTRLPNPSASTGAQKGPQTLENCEVTAMLKDGSLVVQGAIPFASQQPEPSTLAIIGGTGAYVGAGGTVHVSFGKEYDVFSIELTQ
jgi:hypothetical protein